MPDESVAADPAPADAADLLDVLGDGCSRRILAATKEQPMTAKQLSDRCPVSTTTVYRRVNSLLDCGLLREEAAFPSDGAGMTFYRTTFDSIEIRLDEDGFYVDVFDKQSAVERFSRLLGETPDDDIDVDVTEGELRIGVPFTNEVISELAVGVPSDEPVQYNGDR